MWQTGEVMACAMVGSSAEVEDVSTVEGIQSVYNKLVVREVFI
jgi:aerobic-type carbon monoxide dehydrogenase small subunit (CoxS/CutS family)